MNNDKFDGLGINNNKADYEEPKKKSKKLGLAAMALVSGMGIFSEATVEAKENLKDFRESANKTAGLSPKGKTLNPNYRGNKNKMRPRVLLGRVTGLKGNVIAEGVMVRGSIPKRHELFGTLNRATRVNVPSKDCSGLPGFVQKLEKVKIALRKGLIRLPKKTA